VAMDGVVEIITGRERRRSWSTEDKLRIVAETQEAGTRVRDVAARHGMCESLVFTWRRQVREGVLVAPERPVFLPVRMLEPPLPPAAASACPDQPPAAAPHSARSQAGLIEIELGDGRQVRVGRDVNLAALRRVLAALRG
jgi:transposase